MSARNGELAFKGPLFTAWLVAPDGSGLHPVSLPDAMATITPWAYSPDGTHIVYNGYERGDSGDYAIYVSNADGSDITDLTSTYLDPAENNQGEPVWSPDSTQIAFDNDSNDPSMQGVYLMNSDGTEIHKIAHGGFPAWSPDGESIAFEAGVGEGNSNLTGSFRSPVKERGSGLAGSPRSSRGALLPLPDERGASRAR